jgi:beta-xylosidase
MQSRSISFLIINICLLSCVYGQNEAKIFKWGNWKNWGDLGNGNYLNPVIPADFSDIDCIRVGRDFYAVSSTFQYAPGFIILQSKDLVNWKIISHAVKDITEISPDLNWNKMNCYGRGIWAGSIRYHDKKFWIYFGTPDEGYFMSTSVSIVGPWEPLHNVIAEKGWDDCCPFWDDDGQCYLVGTNFSDNYKIHLFKMTPDGKAIIKKSDKVIHQSDGSEANKLYKISGLYYHLFSEVKSGGGRALMMERSKKIGGPYTEEKQLSYTQKQFNEPNQGGLIQTEKGEWYFLTHHGSGDWSGRVISLLPVTWINNWPVIGKVGKDSIGSMSWSGKMPINDTKIILPQTRDEFNESALLPQWEWNYQPRSEKWSLDERKGWLRLHAFKPLEANNLLTAGNTLTQRTFRTSINEVIVKMDISGMTDGQKAGISHFGCPDYSTLGVICNGNKKFLEYDVKGKSIKSIVINKNILWLKSTWGLSGKSRFYYSIDGTSFTSFGETYQMLWESYRGDRIAIYNYNNKSDKGYIDIDYFDYTLKKSM